MSKRIRQYRVRRKSDGLFAGNRAWGKTHSKNGKFYGSPALALSAIKQAYLEPSEHELVIYEIVEVGVMPMES